MSSSSARIETVISTLAGMEKELDELKKSVEQMKLSLANIAREEAEREKSALLQHALHRAEEESAKIMKEAEAEAQRNIQAAEESLKRLKERLRSKQEEAARIVIDTLLGD